MNHIVEAYKKRLPRETIVIGGIEYPVAKGCSCKTLELTKEECKQYL